MTEASYVAWDDNLYEWPPPEGWYKSTDGKWWPEGYGPGQGDSSSSSSPPSTGTQTVSASTGPDETSNTASSPESSAEGAADGLRDLNPDQTSVLPAGGVSSFVNDLDRDESESQRPVYDELPPIDDIFGLSGDDDEDDDLSGDDSASVGPEGAKRFETDHGRQLGDGPPIDDIIGDDDDEPDADTGIDLAGQQVEPASAPKAEPVGSFDIGSPPETPRSPDGGHRSADRVGTEQEVSARVDAGTAPAGEGFGFSVAAPGGAAADSDLEEPGEAAESYDDDRGHDDSDDDDGRGHDDGHNDDSQDHDDGPDYDDHHHDGYRGGGEYEGEASDDGHDDEQQAFRDYDEADGEDQPDSDDGYLAAAADVVAADPPSGQLAASEATVVVDDVAAAAATQVAVGFDASPGDAGDASQTVAAVPSASPQASTSAVASVAGQVPGGADLTQTIIAGDDATSTSLEVGYGEAPPDGHDHDGYEPAGRAKWPLVVGGLLLLAMAVGLIYLVATADGEAEAPATETTILSTGPGSLGEPYVLGTGVVVFYPVDDVQNRWVLQVLDPVADLTEELTDAGAAAPEGGDILAAARVRVTFQEGGAAGPLSDLGLDAVVAPDRMFVGLTDCGPESLDRSLTLDVGQSVEATVCWAIPESQLPGLILAVTAGPADGTVHLSLR